MAQTNVNIRMDEDLKKQFDEFCEETGLNMSTAICIYVKKVVAEQKIPFEIVSHDPFYSPANIKRLRKAMRNVEEGKLEEHDLIEVDDE